jgi:hypothetical protein
VTEIVVADGRLRLYDDTGHPAVRAWSPPAHPHLVPAQCAIHLSADRSFAAALPTPMVPPSRPRDLAWDAVHGWVDARGLCVIGPHVAGAAHWADGRAELTIPAAATDAEVWASLLLLAGPLLASQGHLLLHAGAIVDATGGAWLLTGPSRAGKSTSVATWSRGGAAWIADDTVLLTNASDTLMCHGWVRPPHLDAGYREGRITGERLVVEDMAPGAFDTARWIASAPVRGVLLPIIAATAPTKLERATAGDALSALLPQSPWLAALPAPLAAAPLALAARLAAMSAWHLRLGADAYGVPSVLDAALGPALSSRHDART